MANNKFQGYTPDPKNEKTTQIDMTDLPSGIYNLNIIYNNKNITNRIIKQ